jgi:hypothetical protein
LVLFALATDEPSVLVDSVEVGLSVTSLEAPLLPDATLERLASRASFFAQPDPLKTIAGEASSLRIEPWQRGQLEGPLSWTPWITSTMCPHFWQA